MSYLRSNRRRGGRRKLKLAAGVVAVCVVLVGVRLLASGTISSAAHTAARPAWYVVSMLDATSPQLGAYFLSKQQLAAENEELRDTLDTYESRMAIFDILAKENARLYDALERSGKDRRLVPAGVLVLPPQTPYDTIIIDAGSDDGVSIGDRVLVHDSSMLGRVVEVYSATARVELVTSDGVETPAVLEDAEIHESVTGRGGGMMTMQLPRDVDVGDDERILTRGNGARVIGRVERIQSSANDSFQTIWATTPVNVSELRWVDVEVE